MNIAAENVGNSAIIEEHLIQNKNPAAAGNLVLGIIPNEHNTRSPSVKTH